MSLNPITPGGVPLPITPTSAAPSPSAGPAGASAAPFASLIDRFLGGAAQTHGAAESAVRDLALGRNDNLHEVMLQVAQADLSFRMVLEIRNRLIEAYQEIMKMQV